MLLGVLLSAFGFDWAFHQTKRTGPEKQTLQALRDFWSQAENQSLSRELSVPHTTWDTTLHALERLANGAMRGVPFDRWLSLADSSRALAQVEPVAASVVGMYAAAAWEGEVGARYLIGPQRDLHPGWTSIVLPLVRNLVEADAIWSARDLVERGLAAVGSVHNYHFRPALWPIRDEFQKLLRSIQQRYASAIAELAWDLRRSCQLETASLQPEAAALCWTLGDVPHARLLAQGTWAPTRSLTNWIVAESLRRIGRDPLTQYIWLSLKDRPAIDLRRHTILFPRINTIYTENAVHELDLNAKHLRDIGGGVLGPFSTEPSRAYADATIGYFRGDVPSDVVVILANIFDQYYDHLIRAFPHAVVRLGAILNLLAPISEEMRQRQWRKLGKLSCQTLRRIAVEGIYDPYDRTLDVPLYYLRPDISSSDASQIAWLEDFRCAHLWHWLTVTTPTGLLRGKSTSPLVERERELLDELRSLRMLRILQQAPVQYRRQHVVYHQKGSGDPADFSSIAQHIPLTDEAFNETRLIARMLEIETDLRTLYEQLASEEPAYASRRISRKVTEEEFIATLRAGPE